MFPYCRQGRELELEAGPAGVHAALSTLLQRISVPALQQLLLTPEPAPCLRELLAADASPAAATPVSAAGAQRLLLPPEPTPPGQVSGVSLCGSAVLVGLWACARLLCHVVWHACLVGMQAAQALQLPQQAQRLPGA